MRRIFLTIAAIATLALAAPFTKAQEASTVYFTRDISPEGLMKVYKALGVEPKGRVAVKISTGESEKSNHLRPELIEGLVKQVKGTLVECNTAYEGSRSSTKSHRKEISKRGYDKIAAVDIMDEEGEIKIPVVDDKWIKYDIVGSHLENYDFMINLAHFKGHAMGGFGGVLKNASIGVASQNGKAYIHSAGKTENWRKLWTNLPEGWMSSPEKNTPFIESMSAAAQAVHNYFAQREGIVYIDVMNNISIDCDCDGSPHKPTIANIGIAASLDPVALDKFCLDQVFSLPPSKENDTKALLERINQRHGTRIVYRAEETGLGKTQYTMIDLDEAPGQAVLKNIFSRKSVRTYTDQPVSDAQVETLLKAAMAAPSGMNIQPWRFVVVREQETKDKLSGGFNKMIAKAPVVIVVCGKTTGKMGSTNRNWTADCAAATENLLLAAEAIGLGAVWTACYPYSERMDPTIEALGLPEEIKPFCIVPVGYPGGNDQPKNKWKRENIHYEKW